jgi:signal transduction histidine kinase
VAAHEPSATARALYQRASSEESLASARLLLDQALEDSPGFIEAAAALYSFGGAIPERTLAALRDDGPALLDLGARVRRAGASPDLVAPFIDRAVDLDAPEARFVRAQLRIEQGYGPRALEDLLAYAASRDPQHLDEARLLRSRLVAGSRTEVELLQARRRLAEDRPEAALAALGERCESSLDADRLVAIGAVHEFSGDLAQALECYRLAVPSPASLRRLARVAGRHPDPRLADELRAAATQGNPEAFWALARIDLAAGRQDAALAYLERFLSAAGPDDPALADARAARDSVLRTNTEAAEVRARNRAALAACGMLLLAGLAAWLWAGATLKGALRGAPRLFPQLARAVNEVRHDVIKHRAGVLGMASDPGVRREEIARALLAPEPASTVVARHYDALRTAARGQGVRLRRLSREPVFGPLVRDLARAETLLRLGGDGRELAEIDRRMRGEHASRLGGLLRMGPRTKLDASAVGGWIRDVEVEMRRGGSSWSAPSILLQGMEVEFPVERGALSTIFANLLRNAQAAAGGGEVIVRLGQERDAAGRNLTVLLVGDSSAHAISLDAIEQRESGRGLALVRDLTREWHGHLVVRAEEPPWTKAVGACFPALPA